MPVFLAVVMTLIAFPNSGKELLNDSASCRVSIPDVAGQTWIGQQWNANRLQDWKIQDGKIRCINSRKKDPIRTAIWLTEEISPVEEISVFDLKVHMSSDPKSKDFSGYAGIIFGIGGREVDHRIRSIVHDKPARDGGLLAVVEPDGRVCFRDFYTGGGGSSWSIGGPLKEGQVLPVPGQEFSGNPVGETVENVAAWNIRLTLSPQANGTFNASLTSYLLNSEEVVCSAILKGLGASQIDGSFGLMSHLGDASSPHLGWGFDQFKVSGSALASFPERALGPIYGVQYSTSCSKITAAITDSPSARRVMEWNLTAQLAPVSPDSIKTCTLELWRPDLPKSKTEDQLSYSWQQCATGSFEALSRTVNFHIPDLLDLESSRFRVHLIMRDDQDHDSSSYYEGFLRSEPNALERPIKVGLISCVKNFTGELEWNSNSIWFPHSDVANGLLQQDPDLVCFAGDQIYEGDISRAELNPPEKMMLDYHTKYLRWYRAFGELTRSRPTLAIPDDHDVYHGNIWGAGGKRGKRSGEMSAQDSGGYKLAPREINAIHRTQTSHLPAPEIKGPVGEGYSVYTTRVEYAGLSIAVISDRQFKSAPRPSLPEGQVVNGWFKNPDFDPKVDADRKGLELLGDAQETFLDRWATDWQRGAHWKILLSQTPFSNVATLPQGSTGGATPGLPIMKPGQWPEGEAPVADCDSGGWPRSQRDDAVKILRKARAIHLAGDQHLASCIRYGVSEFRDAGVAFAGPAVANTWPRRWYPPMAGGGEPVSPHKGTGDYIDGFGNRMTVLAVANPTVTGKQPARLYDRGPGWGLVILDNVNRTATFECWPRYSQPTSPKAQQYPGWPITVTQESLDGRSPYSHLPEIAALEVDRIITVIRLNPKLPEERETIYSWRLRSGAAWSPPVYSAGDYLMEKRVESEGSVTTSEVINVS